MITQLLLLVTSYIATAYYGPNAFPVPDPLDGRVQESLRIEAAADGYFATDDKGRTADITARVQIPLFTRWANLSVWMPIHEWYDWTERGHGTGDVYLSTDIQILSPDFPCFRDKRNRRYIPDMAVRAALKTASGEQSERYRHFDDPGYWFDLSIGKSIVRGDWEVRGSATAGFLCWQTLTSRQDDALYYGLTAMVKHRYVSLRTSWQGYSGWEVGDKPMTITAIVSGHIRGFEPFVRYQYGIRDYPFHQVRIGLAWNVDILNRKTKADSQK